MTQNDHTALANGGELGRRMRAYDWASSPIGPVATWPIALRTLVGVILGAKQPMYAAWGADLTMLYNDAYATILGHKDADALGRPFLDVWSEIRDDLLPLVDRTLAGDSVHMEDITLMVERDGLEPEAHFAFSYTAVRDDHGRVQGLFCVCNETTELVMAGRRQAFRLELEDSLRGIDDADSLVRVAGRILGEHLGADRVGYGEVAPDGQSVLIDSAYSHGVGELHGEFTIDSFGKEAGDRLRRGETVAVGDVQSLDDGDQALWGQAQARSYVSVPIMRVGKLAATLFVNQATPRHWSVEDVGLIGTVAARVSDAVQRARAEEEARGSAARFRTLTQAIPNQVWTARINGSIDWFNERTADYLGSTDTAFGFHGWGAIVHPEDRPIADERWSAALASGDVYEAELRLRRMDGQYRWHIVRGVPDRDFGGKVVRWVGTNTDIDDQKRAELDLAAAKAAAEEANLAKSTFIANMSHELRTPLSAIIGYSEMMAEDIADGCSAEDMAGDLSKVENNARHLLGLINDVLDLSKIESGKMEAYSEDFEVEPMLRDVATTVDSLVAKKGNTLALEIDPRIGKAHTDLLKLRQILLNLLGNAAKFTENGTITLAARRQSPSESGHGGDALVFEVRDTGIGMSQEQLTRLFQRFTQADTSTTRKFGGTGLGLSLTKAFSEMLGGAVSVQSEEGAGSAFTLTLPAWFEADDAAEADPEPETIDPVPAQSLVLVIDDDADQRTLMTRFLNREGFEVQTAADGRTGLALAKKLKPRAVLLDVLMPGVDGWSVLTQLKADPELGRIPVVMVTSVDQRGLAASLGAAEYMLKPVQWDRFRTVMDRFRTSQGSILLVEDDAEARGMIRGMLEDDGWLVTEAGNGREGVEQAATHRPDVVLTDLNMPVMDGFDFLEEFRQVAGCADVPVVVLTARDLTRDDRKRLRGANQILNKGDMSMRGIAERLYRLADTTSRAGAVGEAASD